MSQTAIVDTVFEYIYNKLLKSTDTITHKVSNTIYCNDHSAFVKFGDIIKYTEFNDEGGLDSEWINLNINDPHLFEFLDEYIEKFIDIVRVRNSTK